MILGLPGLDALSVLEQTHLDYASTEVMKDKDGIAVPVMHACRQTLHVEKLMAAASSLHIGKS